MNAKFMLKVGGKRVPCRLTMGAMLLFKRTRGKDASLMDASDLEDMLTLMWCCIVSACKADGVEFSMDFETFACHVTPQDVQQWNEALVDSDEKKSEPQP